MKIKISRSQWEGIGKKAGWMKVADVGSDFQDIYSLLNPMIELLKIAKTGTGVRDSYGLPQYNPQHFEDDEHMRQEIEKAENVVKSYVRFVKSINWDSIERAEQAIESLKQAYSNSLLQ